MIIAAFGRANMRIFPLRYRETTCMTTARAVERQCGEPVAGGDPPAAKRITKRCGFGSEEMMRRSSARLQGVSPQDYRQRFGD
jgi:transcriptional regulator GlxA family with amidase domain